MTNDENKELDNQKSSIDNIDIEDNLILEEELSEEEIQMLVKQAKDFLETAKKVN